MRNLHRAGLRLILGLASCASAQLALAAQVSLTTLVSDDALAHPAQIIDPNLRNAWGIAASATSPFWVSANGTGVSTLYAVNPASDTTTRSALVVTLPGSGQVTGQVFNGGTGFNGDRFLFVGEDGTIAGWRGALGTTAEVLQTASAANYKGVALATIGANSYLYAANFRAGTIDVLKGASGAPNLSGRFDDPNLPSGFAPFNIQNLAGSLYVAYAKQDAGGSDEVAGAGLGIVDQFDLQGNLVARVAAQGSLNAPWGLAIAPGSFGDAAGMLLVGNFGDGTVSLFDPATHASRGQLLDGLGHTLVIDGLWGLAVGNDGQGGSSQRVYFSAGPDGESHGVFGVLTAVPEPASALLLAGGLAVLGLTVRRGHAVRPAPVKSVSTT